MLFDRPLFLQVLEGPARLIDQIKADIGADDRHRDMDIIYTNNALHEREFARWRMECKILGNGQCDDYRELDSRVKRILGAAIPNGELAHQLLLDFRDIQDSFMDLQ